MMDMEFVILAQIVLFIVICLGPILVCVSLIRGLGRDPEVDKDPKPAQKQ